MTHVSGGWRARVLNGVAAVLLLGSTVQYQHQQDNGGKTYGEGMARAPATKAATTKEVLENISEIR